MAQGALLLAVALVAPRSRGQSPHHIMAFSGAAILSLGAGVVLAGALTLGRNLTPFPKPSENAVFVRRGIFSLVRHPIYSGVMLMAYGWTQVWQSWPASLIALGMIPFFDAKARREERWLRLKFPDYQDYEKRVKRFVPGLY